jgi:type II secretory pathway pseudopilin PulG
MAKVLRLLGYVLLGLGVAIIVVGLGAVLVSQGWEAFTDIQSIQPP